MSPWRLRSAATSALNIYLVGQGLHPAYSEPAAFVGLFVVSLALLRYLADTFLRGNVRLPDMADWVGGGLLGFVNAQIAIGVLMIGLLMLPFGGRLMMYSRYSRDAKDRTDQTTGFVKFHRSNIGFFLMPDEFTVGLFNLLAGGSLHGGNIVDEAHPERTFKSVYPDFTEWVFWSGNTVQHESSPSVYKDDAGDGFERGLSVESWVDAE